MRKGIAVLATLALVAFAACSWTSNDINVGQGQTIVSPTDPSPSPGPQCTLGGIQPGTAGDVREIAQGGTVAIGVELLGAQGLPLASSCLGQYSPAWTGGAPCVISGAGYDVAISAPASAPLDAVCSASVSVGGKTGSVSLRVVVP